MLLGAFALAVVVQTEDCNHLNRHLVADVARQVEYADCSEVVSLRTFLGSFSSPEQCQEYRHRRLKPWLLCNEKPTSVGTHCNVNGELSHWETRVLPEGEHPCPELAATALEWGAALDDLASIKDCTPLPISESGNDWSAFVDDCSVSTGGEGVDFVGWEEAPTGSPGGYGLWRGDPYALSQGQWTGQGALSALPLYLQPDFDPAALSSATPPAELLGVAQAHPPLSMLAMQGTCSIEWAALGSGSLEEWSFSTTMHASGMFSDSRVKSFGSGAGRQAFHQLASFDGGNLFVKFASDAEGRVHRTDGAASGLRETLSSDLYHTAWLRDWMRDPFLLATPLPLEVESVESTSEGLEVRMGLSAASSGPIGSVVYGLDESGLHPRWIRFLTASGLEGQRLEFGRYRQVQEGVYRPFFTKLTRYGLDGEAVVSVELQLSQAETAAYDPQLFAPVPNLSQRWRVFD